MIIEMGRQNILYSNAQAVLIPVNCVGVMGKGLALQAAKRFPEIVPIYKADCFGRRLKIGTVTSAKSKSGKVIVFFPTKLHWRNKSKMTYITGGLAALTQWMTENNVTHVAIPRLGCGLGGLQWGAVKPHITARFESRDDVTVELY